MLSLLERRPKVDSTKFSDFFRSSATRDKKKIFAKALKTASTEQQKIVDMANSLKSV